MSAGRSAAAVAVAVALDFHVLATARRRNRVTNAAAERHDHGDSDRSDERRLSSIDVAAAATAAVATERLSPQVDCANAARRSDDVDNQQVRAIGAVAARARHRQ